MAGSGKRQVGRVLKIGCHILLASIFWLSGGPARSEHWMHLLEVHTRDQDDIPAEVTKQPPDEVERYKYRRSIWRRVRRAYMPSSCNLNGSQKMTIFVELDKNGLVLSTSKPTSAFANSDPVASRNYLRAIWYGAPYSKAPESEGAEPMLFVEYTTTNNGDNQVYDSTGGKRNNDDDLEFCVRPTLKSGLNKLGDGHVEAFWALMDQNREADYSVPFIVTKHIWIHLWMTCISGERERLDELTAALPPSWVAEPVTTAHMQGLLNQIVAGLREARQNRGFEKGLEKDEQLRLAVVKLLKSVAGIE